MELWQEWCDSNEKRSAHYKQRWIVTLQIWNVPTKTSGISEAVEWLYYKAKSADRRMTTRAYNKDGRQVDAQLPVTQSMLAFRSIARRKEGPRYFWYVWFSGATCTSRTVESWKIRSLWSNMESNMEKSSLLKMINNKMKINTSQERAYQVFKETDPSEAKNCWAKLSRVQ